MRRTLLLLAGLSCLTLPIAASDSYASIDGAHLKQYVEELAAMSRRYRDNGHPQFWGRIIGTEADAENGRWLLENSRRIGLSDVREQRFDLPPQWMPQSWSVSASGGGKDLPLGSAQPTYRSVGDAGGRLESRGGGRRPGDATPISRAQDLKGKAVFFYSNDYMSRHATASNGAWKRISEKGAAAIFITLMIPGNLRFQFYPVQSPVPTFSLGLEDGLAVRDMIARSPGGAAPRVKLRLDVKMMPDLKTATIWGTLPGTGDENIMVVAHRDGWFEGANDNAHRRGDAARASPNTSRRFPPHSDAARSPSSDPPGITTGPRRAARGCLQHKELFAKTALLINCEHTAANQLVAYNGTVRKANTTSPLMWYVGGSTKLEQIVLGAYETFGVPIYDRGERGAAGEIGRIQNLAPSMQLIDTGLYWHSDRETPDIIPAGGLGGDDARLREDHRGRRWRRSAGSAAVQRRRSNQRAHCRIGVVGADPGVRPGADTMIGPYDDQFCSAL